MHILPLGLVFFMLSAMAGATTVKLVSGDTHHFGRKYTAEEQQILPLFESVIERTHPGVTLGASISFVKVLEKSLWVRLYDSLRIYGIEAGSGRLVLSTQLKPFGEHLFLFGEYMAAADLIHYALGGDERHSQNSLAIDRDRVVRYGISTPLESNYAVGCLQRHPLRYGDIGKDGTIEMLVFLDAQVIVVSMDANEVVFSAHYWDADELPEDEVSRAFPWPSNDEEPLIVANSGTDPLVNIKLPAKRSISKIYFEDFDQDGRLDIIVWRKLYESKNIKAVPKGFELVGDVAVYYTLGPGGSYSLKEVAFKDFRMFLDAHNLSWQKGFPTYSECPGEEGELIPQMHDPLLNDPEVLR